MPKIRVGIIGVGNCASSLVQGVEFYKNAQEDVSVPGLMNVKMGPYHVGDIEFAAAFDIDRNKVWKDLSEAIFAPPNNTYKFANVPNLSVPVQRGMTHDSIGKYLTPVVEKHPSPTVDVVDIMKSNRVDVVLNYLPVGSESATKWYVEQALEARCGFVNCIPVFIASEKRWQEIFLKRGLPIVGDDIKSQVGATILHRTLTQLFINRGVKLLRTLQLNIGGNSVSGEEELLLEVNGVMKRYRIGEFIDEMIRKYGTEAVSEKEYVDLARIGATVKCYTVDAKNHVALTPVRTIMRHKIAEPLFRVELEGGRSITVTGDHNLFTVDGEGSLVPAPAEELIPGRTWIIVPRRLQSSEAFQQLEEYEVTIAGGQMVLVRGHPRAYVPVSKFFSENIMTLFGLWVADGSYDRRGPANVELAVGNDEECMALVKNVCSELGLGHSVRGEKRVAVRIYSKTLGMFMRDVLGFKGDCYTKRVPDWVFGLPEELICAFLRGYFSGDGALIGKQARATSTSRKLIDDIRTLLLRVGIYSTSFKERVSRRSKSFSKRRHFPHILISEVNSLRLFSAKIGFLQNSKNRLLNIAISSRKYERSFLPRLKLFEIAGIKPKTTYKVDGIEKRIILSQLDRVTDHELRDRIIRLCSDDISFLKVKKVTQLKPKSRHVYDLSVPGYERFVCSNILVHNTDFLNMLERERLHSKKISKTRAVSSLLAYDIGENNIHIGPSDHVAWLEDRKWAYIRMEGAAFGNTPLNVELKLEVWDSPNSAGVVIDALRCVKIAMDRGIAGVLDGPSAYFMKSPPTQYPDDEARAMVQRFVNANS